MARFRLFLVAPAAIGLLAASTAGFARPSTRQHRAETPAGPATFIVTGRGWGHGVGMAQWGAYGFAQHGMTYDQILAHYYRNTSLGPAEVARVRVQMASGASRVTVGSNQPFTVHDGIGQLWHLPAGDQKFGPGLRLQTTDVPQRQQLPSPITFQPGAAPLRFGGRPYRGQLDVSVVDGALRAVNNVQLEAYLYGVVPSEMPYTWVPEALKVQAVAARSYALAVRKLNSWFDLYPDTRSQVYSGIAGEKASATAAVQETAGEVVLYNGKVATTYFYSSSGGRTAAADEVWAGPPVPYLQSVNDPYDTISPHHRWGPIAISAARLDRVLGAPGKLVDVRLAKGPSGRVKIVTAVGTQGEATATGSDVRRALDLRSTWFRIGVLSLTSPAEPITSGKKVALSGVARSMPSVKLEQRTSGTTWSAVRQVAPGPGGQVHVKTRPRFPTDFRLVSGDARSRVAHVKVAPLIRLKGLKNATTFRGYARPIFEGAVVSVQRLEGSRWVTVGRGGLDASGDFLVEVTLSPGSYRARMSPGHGFVAGVSPTLKVGPA